MGFITLVDSIITVQMQKIDSIYLATNSTLKKFNSQYDSVNQAIQVLQKVYNRKLTAFSSLANRQMN